jgi:hypothetical protein
MNKIKPTPMQVGRWGQERRLEFIDFRLLWDRTVNRGDVVDFFRVSIQQASADLAAYAQLAPRNLRYDKTGKTYRATEDFKPILAQADAQAFLDQLAAVSRGTALSSGSFLGWRPPYDLVRLPARPISTGLLLRLLWAIRDGEDLRALYQSMRRTEPTLRWVAPHALAYNGLRWHVRAWCFENNEFRDFVISRIQRIDASRRTQAVAGDDSWWHSTVEVIIRPRTDLTIAQRSAIAADYGMARGQLRLTCRKALAFYLLRQLQLDRAPDQSPAAQPLELMNRDELSDVFTAAQKSSEAIPAPRAHTLENHG